MNPFDKAGMGQFGRDNEWSMPDPVNRTKGNPGNMALPLTWLSEKIFGKDKKSNVVVPPSQANASQAAIPQPTAVQPATTIDTPTTQPYISPQVKSEFGIEHTDTPIGTKTLPPMTFNQQTIDQPQSFAANSPIPPPPDMSNFVGEEIMKLIPMGRSMFA